jgi:hypothetical protein
LKVSEVKNNHQVEENENTSSINTIKMKKLDSKEAKEIGEDIGIDWDEVKLEKFTKVINLPEAICQPENYQKPFQNRFPPLMSLKSNFLMPEKPGLAVDGHG